MIKVSPSQVTESLSTLFDPDEPAGIRCVGVLEGIIPGQILTDDLVRPSYGIVREGAYGTLYLGGDVKADLLRQVISDLSREGEVLIGFWADDPRVQLLPPAQYEGWVLDFTDRPLGKGLDNYLMIPEGCQIRLVDEELISHCVDGEGQIAAFGSIERALTDGFGFCLMRDDDILSEALCGPPIRGVVEIGTATREAHRGRGYATITSAYLVDACENAGYQTYWNCNVENAASATIARKLGYRSEKRYTLFAWFQAD